MDSTIRNQARKVDSDYVMVKCSDELAQRIQVFHKWNIVLRRALTLSKMLALQLYMVCHKFGTWLMHDLGYIPPLPSARKISVK